MKDYIVNIYPANMFCPENDVCLLHLLHIFICRSLFVFYLLTKAYYVAEICKISSFLVDRKISYQKGCPNFPDSKDQIFWHKIAVVFLSISLTFSF